MEIVFDAQGNVLYTDPERFYQGSNLANVIGVTAPWASATQVTIAFTLPNGVNLSEALMTNTGEVKSTTGIYRWTYTVPVAVTEYAGNVTFQVRVYNPAGQIIASGSGGVLVEVGVPVELPDTPTQDIYQQILQELSRVEASADTQISALDTKYEGITDDLQTSLTETNNNLSLVKEGVSALADGTQPAGRVANKLTFTKSGQFISEYDGSMAVSVDVATGVGAVYVPQGSIPFASLPAEPTQAQLGFVWDISDDFTTDDRFIEGAGLNFPAGTNVVVAQEESNYKYDVLSGFLDLSGYAQTTGSYPAMTVGEATTVPDEAITEEKLSPDVQEKVNASTAVVANPTGATVGELETIGIAGSNYQIPIGELVFTDTVSDSAVLVVGFTANGQQFKFPDGSQELQAINTALDSILGV